MNFEEYVNNLKRKLKLNNRKILFVCIGTGEVLWDSVGPLVGEYLKKRLGKENVLGDMKKNICSKKDLICNYRKMKNRYIVAIDTAITNEKITNEIFISNNPIVMGMGIDQNKGIVGDLSIKVNIADYDRVNKKYIKFLAEFVGKGIYKAIRN